jgi:hypothetical protein
MIILFGILASALIFASALYMDKILESRMVKNHFAGVGKKVREE